MVLSAVVARHRGPGPGEPADRLMPPRHAMWRSPRPAGVAFSHAALAAVGAMFFVRGRDAGVRAVRDHRLERLAVDDDRAVVGRAFVAWQRSPAGDGSVPCHGLSHGRGHLWVRVGWDRFQTKVVDEILWIKSDFAMSTHLVHSMPKAGSTRRILLRSKATGCASWAVIATSSTSRARWRARVCAVTLPGATSRAAMRLVLVGAASRRQLPRPRLRPGRASRRQEAGRRVSAGSQRTCAGPC